ncbi:uncharacterized protein LOC131615147 [Vicia villosa]|uniref:uncharacterized protein LOC131615147 n=1 Tax=Vicia villosa TaxID=3911 RepID=UPI00273B84F2|nr:uncharacterized protein LOC131615147 [Vicia villosa]
MGEDEKVAGYVSKVENLVHLLEGCGETLTDKIIVEKVMCMLTSHFNHVIIAIQESNNLETQKLDDLVGLLEAHEIRVVEIQALQTQSWKKHGGSEKFKGKRDKTQSKKSWSNPQKKDKGVTKGKDERVNLARQDSNDYDDLVLMVASVDEHVESKILFLDLSWSNHMTGRKIWLADFDELKKSKVKFTNNNSLQEKGIGNIVIQTSNGAKAMIKDVLYVPKIKYNLFSVAHLVEKGFSIVMKDGALELFNTQNNLVLKSPLSNNRTFKTIVSSMVL